MSNKFAALTIIVPLLFQGGSAVGETCQQCQQKVRMDWTACVKQLPKKIKPAVRGKPTDAEKQAIAERVTKSRTCSIDARAGFENCRITARCP